LKDFLKEARFFYVKSDKVISTEEPPFYKENTGTSKSRSNVLAEGVG
jgi:hypothetical protein